MNITSTAAMASMSDRIRTKLESALLPQRIEVVDDSDKHAGHVTHPGGAGQGGETHFTVKIVSDAFAGLTRVARHRRVNELLSQELADGVHALAIEARAPGEDLSRF